MNLITPITIVANISAFILGAILTLLIIYKTIPKVMMVESESKYDFEKSAEVFEQSIKDAGWSVSGIHDLKKTLKGFGYEIGEVKAFELCKADHSSVVLSRDDERIISPLMPCRVSLYTKSDGKTYISRMNSLLMAKPFGGLISDIMKKAAIDTEKILESIIK
jgi:uncharacterized protein (DUF302 family)